MHKLFVPYTTFEELKTARLKLISIGGVAVGYAYDGDKRYVYATVKQSVIDQLKK